MMTMNPMAPIYAKLIRKGLKKLEDIKDEELRREVEELLAED